MTVNNDKGTKFGELAISLKYINEEQLSRALVVQERIFKKTRVNMPIGDVLIEMNVISDEDRKEVLRVRRQMASGFSSDKRSAQLTRAKKESGVSTPEDSSLDIVVSKDKLTAHLQFFGDVSASEFGIEDVKMMLQAEDIVFGVADDKQIKAYLNGEFNVGEPWEVASGTRPIPPSPPAIRYHFDTDPCKVGTLKNDGLMDWKDRGKLPQVKEGDLLAELLPGFAGKEGMDVHGKTVPNPKQNVQLLKCGKGARKAQDGKRAHATLSGLPKLSILGEISVVPTLHIKGDICLETGHVDFDGHIEVMGTIEKGYRVKGKSLRAKEILEAEIDIDGDIAATDGIFGAVIRSQGHLKAGHIHNSDITITGDITVEKEIIESTIETNGQCMIIDGIVLSSRIIAKMGIVAMDMGTPASKPSDLVVGIDQQLEKTYEETKIKIQAETKATENLTDRIKILQTRSEEVNTILGEVAQKQDKCMVQHRRLQEKMEAVRLNQSGNAMAKLQHTINDLKEQQESFDLEVARLMGEDEAIEEKIAEAQKEIENKASSIAVLEKRLTVIAEKRKTECGNPTLKIGGNIIAGTKIKGPNSFLKVEKNLSRLSFAETIRTDVDGVKRWRMDFGPFR